jgi:hypothetical protein
MWKNVLWIWAESDMIDDQQKYTGSYIVLHTS